MNIMDISIIPSNTDEKESAAEVSSVEDTPSYETEAGRVSKEKAGRKTGKPNCAVAKFQENTGIFQVVLRLFVYSSITQPQSVNTPSFTCGGLQLLPHSCSVCFRSQFIAVLRKITLMLELSRNHRVCVRRFANIAAAPATRDLSLVPTYELCLYCGRHVLHFYQPVV
ncbi:hypothetical protein J6590_046560 [Homalodisca vitripennis]|nr:hypothetical protein J6590_046560 [Homalodisca vitripennis]